MANFDNDNGVANPFSAVERITRKDMKTAAISLGEAEARYLVDLYYQAQGFRVAAGNQRTAALKSAEPYEAINLIHDQFQRVEENIALALDIYTENHPIGSRIRTVKGIGPVIAAGFIANLKIELNEKPINSVGSWWRFCGLDPTMKWHGSKVISQMIKEALKSTTDIEAFLNICERTNRKPSDVLFKTEHIDSIIEPEGAFAICDEIRGDGKRGLAMLHADNIFKELLSESHPKAYQNIYFDMIKGSKIDWTSIHKYMSMRPWNTSLKRLCWLLGESFVKVKSRDGAFYGQYYAEWRDKYQERNDSGGFKDNAQERLDRSGSSLNAELRKLYQSGKLPDKALHEMAKRKAVQMFLSHMHQVWFEEHFQRPSPQPYSHAILKHKDFIEPTF